MNDDLILTGAWVTPNIHICWRPGPTCRGWAKPVSMKSGKRLQKAHYFHAEQSLCHQWGEYGGPVLDEQPENVCATCLRKAKRKGWAA